jgi:FixJ family two-component response regulator
MTLFGAWRPYLLEGGGNRCRLHMLSRTRTVKMLPVISIVDDDESICLAIESLVSSLGFDVRTFPSAEAFLAWRDRHETACVISDVQMPDMSGLELQRQLIADGDRTPIMFITAFANDRIRAQAMRAGAVCFLLKPFTASALIEGLQKALGDRMPTIH